MISPISLHLAKITEAHSANSLVSDYPGEGERLLEEESRTLKVTLLEFLSPQAHEREGNTMLITQLTVERQRFSVEHNGLFDVAATPGERSCFGQGLRSRSSVGALTLA
jgi:hypothetical protein